MFSRKKKEEKKEEEKKVEVPAPQPPAPPVQMKGDLAIKPYRRQTKDPVKQKERKNFETKLKQISAGYKSTKVCEIEFLFHIHQAAVLPFSFYHCLDLDD